MAEWFMEEDPELLAATLSLVAAWGDDGEPLSSSASTSPQSVVDTRTARDAGEAEAEAARGTATGTRTRQINVARERRKRDLRLLREETARLEGHLLSLQKKRKELLRPHFKGRAIQSTAPVWECLARRQWEARKRSEATNASLRAQAADQALVARELTHAIQVALQRLPVQDKPSRIQLPIDVSLKLSEEQQLQRLATNVPRWEWALSLSPKFKRGELQFRDYKVVKRSAESATLDVYASCVLPFTVTSVADLLWSSFQQESRGEADGEEVDKLVQEQKRPDDLIIAVFQMQTTMGGATAKQGVVHGKWVAKQQHFDAYDQRLSVTQWHYEMTGFGNELDGVCVFEDTWQRVVDAREIGHTHLQEPLAVLQHVRRVRIDFNRSHRADTKHVKTVTDLFIKQIDADLNHGLRSLENALTTQALGL